MSNPIHSKNDSIDGRKQSYGALYIYYLEGKLPSAIRFVHPHFIGNWEEEGFSFLFFSEPSDEFVLKFIQCHRGLKLLDQYHMSYEEWQGGKFSWLQIGRFLIIPPWENTELDVVNPEQIKITLDPGVVFGNGLHPTTQDCIEALELLCSSHSIECALDLGCGTGILALVAAKLGCRKCLAVDFNLLASQTATRNVKENGLTNNILVAQAKAEDLVGLPADLLMANIHYDVMQRLLESNGFYNKKWYILSGLLRSQAKAVTDRLERSGVKILKKWEREGIWHTFWGKIS